MVRTRKDKSLPAQKHANPSPPASTELIPAVLHILAKIKDGTGAPKLSTDKNFHAEDLRRTASLQLHRLLQDATESTARQLPRQYSESALVGCSRLGDFAPVHAVVYGFSVSVQ